MGSGSVQVRAEVQASVRFKVGVRITVRIGDTVSVVYPTKPSIIGPTVALVHLGKSNGTHHVTGTRPEL